jgi:hypothetical protein
MSKREKCISFDPNHTLRGLGYNCEYHKLMCRKVCPDFKYLIPPTEKSKLNSVKDALVSQLIITIEEHLPPEHLIRHSNSFKQLKKQAL